MFPIAHIQLIGLDFRQQIKRKLPLWFKISLLRYKRNWGETPFIPYRSTKYRWVVQAVSLPGSTLLSLADLSYSFVVPENGDVYSHNCIVRLSGLSMYRTIWNKLLTTCKWNVQNSRVQSRVVW
jgi:hypothetical protein